MTTKTAPLAEPDRLDDTTARLAAVDQRLTELGRLVAAHDRDAAALPLAEARLAKALIDQALDEIEPAALDELKAEVKRLRRAVAAPSLSGETAAAMSDRQAILAERGAAATGTILARVQHLAETYQHHTRTALAAQRALAGLQLWSRLNDTDGDPPGINRQAIGLAALRAVNVAPTDHQTDAARNALQGALGRYHDDARAWANAIMLGGVATFAEPAEIAATAPSPEATTAPPAGIIDMKNWQRGQPTPFNVSDEPGVPWDAKPYAGLAAEPGVAHPTLTPSWDAA